MFINFITNWQRDKYRNVELKQRTYDYEVYGVNVYSIDPFENETSGEATKMLYILAGISDYTTFVDTSSTLIESDVQLNLRAIKLVYEDVPTSAHPHKDHAARRSSAEICGTAPVAFPHATCPGCLHGAAFASTGPCHSPPYR